MLALIITQAKKDIKNKRMGWLFGYNTGGNESAGILIHFHPSIDADSPAVMIVGLLSSQVSYLQLKT